MTNRNAKISADLHMKTTNSSQKQVDLRNRERLGVDTCLFTSNQRQNTDQPLQSKPRGLDWATYRTQTSLSTRSSEGW
jgi:hypothetical protein